MPGSRHRRRQAHRSTRSVECPNQLVDMEKRPKSVECVADRRSSFPSRSGSQPVHDVHVSLGSGTGKRRSSGSALSATVLVLAGLSSCADGPPTSARQSRLKTVEGKVTSAKLGRLILHHVGGKDSVSGDKPFRYSYYETAAGDGVAAFKARLGSTGLIGIREDQRCDSGDPCAFEDPSIPNVLVSVVVADRKTIMTANKVDLPTVQGDVIVVGIF